VPIERLRNVGKVGIITDLDPYDLPMEAFSAGVNVRFRNNKVTGAPVFRDVLTLGTTDPRFLFAASPTNISNELFIGYKYGTITQYSNGAETNYTLSGYTNSYVEATWTATVLDGVVYMNRSDRAPWYLLTSGTSFQNLGFTPPTSLTTNAATTTSQSVLSFASGVPTNMPVGISVYDAGLFVGYVLSVTSTSITLSSNAAVPVSNGATITFGGQWDNTWSTLLLRQCSNALVALNVTKGATSLPNLVKTSSPVTTGQTPASWDITQANTLASENTLGAMDGPITDACSLGQDLIIYGRREAWRMHADGSVFVYDYTKLPFKKGSLNANCSIELDGKNYVFGMDDIWVHDGVSEQSLCDQQVREFIFNSLSIAQAAKCYVTYNPRLNEIYFAYVSADAYTNFLTQSGVDGCNRQAVLNLTNNSWTFDDLPSTWSAAYAPLPNFQTYNSTSQTYTTIGGSYQDQEDGDKRVIAMVGSVNATYGLSTQLYAFDLYGTGSVAAFPVDSAATATRYLERVGFDMNELNTELRGYKTLSTIYPQARVDTSGGSYMMISVGASDNISDLTTSNWSPWMQYDGDTNYKLDFNIAGRWLGIRIQWADYRALTITGFDYDIRMTGNR
jgi:hypothetical protein